MILELFTQYPLAHERLLEVLVKLVDERPPSSGTKGTPATLAERIARLQTDLLSSDEGRKAIMQLSATGSVQSDQDIGATWAQSWPQGWAQSWGQYAEENEKQGDWGQYAEMRGLTPKITRYTDISCPRRVWIGTPRVSIVARLTVHPSVYSATNEEFIIRAGLPVLVRVTAPYFEVLGPMEQETEVLLDLDSPPLIFDLRPLNPGHTRITFDFFQAGNPVGTVSVPLEITTQETSTTIGTSGTQALRIDPNTTPPDLMLYVAFERFGAQSALVFTLFRHGEVGRTFHPVPLSSDPLTQSARLYQSVTELTDQIDPTAKVVLLQRRMLSSEDVDRRLKRFGQNLWRELFPDDLKALYGQERDDWRGKSLLIVSDEPYFPWELVLPYKSGEWEDDEPWCTRLRLTRWLRRDAHGNGHEAPPGHLELNAVACFAPIDSGLVFAEQELAFLTTLIRSHNLSDLSPVLATRNELLSLLERGGYDWIHLAAHGNFYSVTPDMDSAIWLQNDRPLTPTDIVGSAIEGHIHQHRPAFVFNACHSGRQGWALNGLAGWANRLISTGASLFLAPLWAVTDAQAMLFAKTFYQELFAGQTVGEAVRQARLAAQRAGDPTWLAYSVYAHPNARMAISAERKA